MLQSLSSTEITAVKGICLAAFLLFLFRCVFTPPQRLSHLPVAPVFPLLRSYLSGEAEDRRIQRIILPFANEHHHSLVLVWVFGMWMIHVLDYDVSLLYKLFDNIYCF